MGLSVTLPDIIEIYRGYTITISQCKGTKDRGVLIKKGDELINQCHIVNFKVAKRLINTFLEANYDYPYPLPIKFKKQPAVGFAIK